MAYTTPPPTPNLPPPPAPKKSRTNAIIIGSAVAVIAAVIGTGVVVVQSRDDSAPAAVTKSSAPAEDVAPAVEEEPDPTPSYEEIDPSDFEIKLKTKSKNCFGSAGCNLTLEPDLTLLVDSSEIDPDATYEITYEIHGGDSGPVIETAELSGQTSLNFTPSLIQTASSGTKVSVEITDVTQGL